MDSKTLLMTLRHASIECTQRSLVKKLGFSIGKINYVLKALIEEALIKAERFALSDSKLNYRYVLIPQGLKQRIELTEKFIERKNKNTHNLPKSLKSSSD